MTNISFWVLIDFFFVDLRTTSFYHDYIPSVPELGAGRKFDSSRLKEIRKRLDNAEDGAQEAEVIAFECMDEIAEITSGKMMSRE